jgi:hypothetical protein
MLKEPLKAGSVVYGIWNHKGKKAVLVEPYNGRSGFVKIRWENGKRDSYVQSGNLSLEKPD